MTSPSDLPIIDAHYGIENLTKGVIESIQRANDQEQEQEIKPKKPINFDYAYSD